MMKSVYGFRLFIAFLIWSFDFMSISAQDGMDDYSTRVANYGTLSNLYSGYSNSQSVLPLFNASMPMTIYVDIIINALSDFDEVSGAIEIDAALILVWNDEMVSAINGYNFPYNSTFFVDPNPASELNTLMVPYTMIWTPSLIFTTSVGSSKAIGDLAFKCRYNITDGTVVWIPRITLKSACSPDVTYYPFDRQTCKMILVPWGYTSSEIQFVAISDAWDKRYFEENGEWKIIETKSEAALVVLESQMHFEITIERRPLYYSFNIIFPVIILSMLNGMVFWLPIESGERVGFSVTCFLTFVVLLNMIMSFLPRTSSPMSYLCYYLVIMMAFSGLTAVVVIIEIKFYNKDDADKVPNWVKKVLTILTFQKCRNKQAKTDTEADETVDDSATNNVEGNTNMKNGKARSVSVSIGNKVAPTSDESDQDKPENDDGITWKTVIQILDISLFILFIGSEAFYTICFLFPLAYSS